ncbi:hypothetical protein VYU27_007163 [Nannochloropsis oceanica]
MVVTTKLRSAFTRAAKWVKEHHKEANVANSVLFRLYGLYKRSTAGACNVRVPTILVEPIARERYNSWKLASGLSEEQAMREYLDLVRISFPAFAKAAASELKDLDDLKSVKEENRALLEETTEVLALYSKLQQDSIVKRGHLYKWHAEQVGFGGSKWQRRYLILQGTSLRVYSTAEAAAPIKTIPLQGCVVRTEPPKKGGQYHVFALYPMEGEEEDEEEDEDDPLSPDEEEGPDLEEGGVVIRLSTESKADSQEWVEAINQACILATAKWERQRSDLLTPRAAGEEEEEEGEEEEGWAEGGEAGDDAAAATEEFEDGPPSMDSTTPTSEERRAVSKAAEAAEAVLKKTLRLRRQVSQQRRLMAASMRSASSSLLPSAGTSTTTIQEEPAAGAVEGMGGREGGKKVEERAHKLDPNLFPPSMSMHKLTRPSVLSIEYPSRDYTGYLNLAMIILGVHFSHAVVDCVSLVWRYGVQLPKHSLVEVPCLMCALSLTINIFLAWFTEYLASRRFFPSSMAVGVLHSLNCLWTLLYPCHVAWSRPDVPLHTFLLLFWSGEPGGGGREGGGEGGREGGRE